MGYSGQFGIRKRTFCIMGPRVNRKKLGLTKKGKRKETVIKFLLFGPKPGELPMDRHILENIATRFCSMGFCKYIFFCNAGKLRAELVNVEIFWDDLWVEVKS